MICVISRVPEPATGPLTHHGRVLSTEHFSSRDDHLTEPFLLLQEEATSPGQRRRHVGAR